MSAEDVSEGSGSEASGDEFEEETIVPVSTATPAALAAAPVAPTGGPVTATASAGPATAFVARGSRSGAVEDAPDPMARQRAMLRLRSDMRAIAADPPSGCSASPSEEDIFRWTATVVGPEETAWEGGIFTLRLQFPDQYPEKAPRVRFVCDMFHPNVFADGSLCLDIIQDMWKPIYTVGMLLTSIQSLLSDPNCNSPANLDAAQLLLTNPKEYRKRVRKIAQKSVEG